MSGCRHPVSECVDDMCRNSVERGLCGRWVEDDDDLDDIAVDHWDECCETGACE